MSTKVVWVGGLAGVQGRRVADDAAHRPRVSGGGVSAVLFSLLTAVVRVANQPQVRPEELGECCEWVSPRKHQ